MCGVGAFQARNWAVGGSIASRGWQTEMYPSGSRMCTAAKTEIMMLEELAQMMRYAITMHSLEPAVV